MVGTRIKPVDNRAPFEAFTEVTCSYTATKGTCKASNLSVEPARGSVTGYRDVPTESEQALMSAVAEQHVPIAIEAWRSQSRVLRSGRDA